VGLALAIIGTLISGASSIVPATVSMTSAGDLSMAAPAIASVLTVVGSLLSLVGVVCAAIGVYRLATKVDGLPGGGRP
jgi:hypothetical protein